MFRILKYSHDRVTDTVEIRVVFQLKSTSEIKEDGGMFPKKYSADKWLEQSKKDYFTLKIQNYLYHKKHIIEAGPGHKSHAAKKQALSELYRFLEWACTKASLPEICKWCLNMNNQFTQVLPSATNPSYNSSMEALNEIIAFAKLHVNGSIIK